MNQYRAERVMKTLFKASGAIFWVACMVVVAPFALIALGLFRIAYGSAKEMEGY